MPSLSGLSMRSSMPGSALPTLPGMRLLPGACTLSTGAASVSP
jgi:hypothetical protein